MFKESAVRRGGRGELDREGGRARGGKKVRKGGRETRVGGHGARSYGIKGSIREGTIYRFLR